jgi:hypothetical protein
VNLEKFLSIYVIARKAKQSHFLQGVALAAFGNLAMTAFFFSSLYYPSSSNIYLSIYFHSAIRIPNSAFV